jgi:hypothetical protein
MNQQVMQFIVARRTIFHKCGNEVVAAPRHRYVADGALGFPARSPDGRRDAEGHPDIALTAEEAVEHATHCRLGDAWRFVVEPNDLRGKYPSTNKLIFAGEWRERRDLALLRLRAEGQGFTVPR